MFSSSRQISSPGSDEAEVFSPFIAVENSQRPCDDERCASKSRNSSSTPSKEGSRPTNYLLSPPNATVNIGHLFVYSFSPRCPDTALDFLTPTKKGPKTTTDCKPQSPSGSSGPFCRICHDGDAVEDLLSLCHCTGTMGLVHMSCMERWLSASESDRCEICHYAFATMRTPRSFMEWLRSPASRSQHRSVMGDTVCFFLLSPLVVVISFLCVEGAKRQVQWHNSLEAGCLMALATFLITIFAIWSGLTLKYHFKHWRKWRARNQYVKVLRIRRLSSTTTTVNSVQRYVATQNARTSRVSSTENNLGGPNTPVTDSENATIHGASNLSQPVANNLTGVLVYPRIDINTPEILQQITAMIETDV